MTKDELERMMVAQPDAQSGGLSLFAVLSMALGLIGAFVIILSNLAG